MSKEDLFLFIVSMYVLCSPPHPLNHQLTLYKQRIQPWKTQFLAAANHVPFLFLPTSLLPS